ncbi:MAG: TauD/TfdA family dioxygenase [Alphaproteobacteria bacterium]|nr:TauD/TfdA family dioxygenase [Alphaproteobacteria bacterium]
MSANAFPKTPFDSSFPIEEVVFPVECAATIADQALTAMAAAFNSVGFFVLACPPRPEPRENLLALAPLLGRVVPHNRSDCYGVLAVNPSKKVPGFIDSSYEAHPPHTDGSFKDAPEKVIVLQCVVPASVGGTSFLGSGKLAHDRRRRPIPPACLPSMMTTP